MADLFRAIVLGGVQGLTEFLPVSSDGHLLLVRYLFGWPDEGLTFDTVLHLGTFLAVLVTFRTTWQRLLLALLPRGAREDRRLFLLIMVATVPAALIGYLAEDIIGGRARGLSLTAAGFLGSAVLLILGDFLARRRVAPLRDQPTLLGGLAIGCLQIFALLPGLSRSGSTIAGGLIGGLSRERAVEFSFLLSLPIVGGAGLYGLLQWGENGAHHPLTLGIGALAALFSGLWAIRLLQRLARHQSFIPFSVYLVLLGIFTWMLERGS